MPEKSYSVNMLIALFTDFKEDGFRTLSESEVQEALQALSGPTPVAADASPEARMVAALNANVEQLEKVGALQRR